MSRLSKQHSQRPQVSLNSRSRIALRTNVYPLTNKPLSTIFWLLKETACHRRSYILKHPLDSAELPEVFGRVPPGQTDNLRKGDRGDKSGASADGDSKDLLILLLFRYWGCF